MKFEMLLNTSTQEQIHAQDLTQLNRILNLYKIVQVFMNFQRPCRILKDLKHLEDYQQDLDHFS